MIGERVAHYEVLSSLGIGAVGSVYRARDTESGASVALKLLHPTSQNTVDVQRRFIREVTVLQKLDHPNIVQYYDCGIHEGQYFLAMEQVDCGTLKDVLKGGRVLPWRDAVDVAIQICAALEVAHAKGVIHRDLKPANLFLSKDGLVKVGDFGLARAEDLSRLTEAGTTVGTCRYMPPEQIAGEERLTGAVDLYALGCLLFEMLVGRSPFDGTTLVMVFEKHMFADPENPCDLIAGCPADLGELVLKLLAKEPANRPPSAAIVKDWLKQIVAGEAVDWEKTIPAHLPAEPPTEASVGGIESEEGAAMPNLTERLHAGLTEEPKDADWRFAVLALILLAIVVGVALWLR